MLKQHLARITGISGHFITSLHYLIYCTTILIRNYSVCLSRPVDWKRLESRKTTYPQAAEQCHRDKPSHF